MKTHYGNNEMKTHVPTILAKKKEKEISLIV